MASSDSQFSFRDDDDELDDYNDHDAQREMVSLVGSTPQGNDSDKDDDSDESESSIKHSSMSESFQKFHQFAAIKGSKNIFSSRLGLAVVVFCLLLFALHGGDSNDNSSAADYASNDSGKGGWGSSLRHKKKHHSSSSQFPARPGTGGFQEPGYKMTPNRLSPKYLPRSKLSQKEKQELAEQWGHWTFVDAKASQRPADDFYAKYPNRDVPRSEFPQNAWQLDKTYLASFLQESIQLVERSMEAILGEYGHSKFDEPDLDFDERSKMFHVNLVNLTREDGDYTSEFQHDIASSAGWHDLKGWDNLQRRILHAIMTEDSFTYVMGGHSSAAGHGNHFWQSYTLQLGKVMEPVFARMGVFFRALNVGMGGLGTTQNAMGAKDVYGADIDILYWDSQMTEKNPFMEYFLRAGLISGNRVPVIWNTMAGSIPQAFAKETGADVGNLYGGSMAGIRKMESITDADSMPWAARFLNCDTEINGECNYNSNKYNTKCWIKRDDFVPSTHQYSLVGGQASWHPGWRWHQLLGRAQAFALLRATHAALVKWNATEGFALADDAWHVTKHFDNIRSKAISTRPCQEMNINPLFCTRPIHSRTEFTPRALGYHASIRSIMKGHHVPKVPPNVYDPPDVDYAFAEPPQGEVDVLKIIENGVIFPVNMARKKHVDWLTNPLPVSHKSQDYMTPGQGMALIDTRAASDNCDGTIDSWCNRGDDQACLLHHHNDGRGGMGFDGLSGWLVMNLADVQEGFIALKLETWRAGGCTATANWTCENNLCAGNVNSTMADHDERALEARMPHDASDRLKDKSRRDLRGAPAPKPCTAYKFEFAIDGQITTWDAETFDAQRNLVERVVEVFELVHDKNLTQETPRDVELAVRLSGCGRLLTYSLTHVYWA